MPSEERLAPPAGMIETPYGYMPLEDGCDNCGATENLMEVSVGYERIAILCVKHRAPAYDGERSGAS